MAPVLTVVPHWQDQPFDGIVALYRFLNALLMLPLLMFQLARKVALTKAVPVAAAFGCAPPRCSDCSPDWRC